MKRKIAAIMAADVAGYSRLVAEDEEETLRRLASYRSVMDDFIAKASGRIFNTAGDAVLAEFGSSVEAVRAAIDIQESLRTRNLAYPASRQMNFRIGITVGDVVERDGDLLGDAVNIAARLEGLAEAGGICVSRAVFEQVANKLSVRFSDIGEQLVKNIPTPVHVYTVAMRSSAVEDAGAVKSRLPHAAVFAAAAIVVLAAGAFAYRSMMPGAPPAAPSKTEQAAAAPSASPASALPQAASAPAAAAPAGLASLDEAKVRAQAAHLSIPLPPVIRLVTPSTAVPRAAAAYLGVWGGEGRWNGIGRQIVLIVTDVDPSSGAVGFLGQGPPNPNTSNQSPASHRPFSGAVTEKGLAFDLLDGRWQYRFKIRQDGFLEGHLIGPNVNASIAIERIQ